MPEPFPEFPDPALLPDGRTWTAEFESYDLRKDNAYYFVTLDGDRSFFVVVGVEGGVPDRDDLSAQIARHAATGEPNTDYKGSMMWRLRRG